MYPDYGAIGQSIESKLRLEPAEDAAIGSLPAGNGYQMLREEVDIVRSTCQKLARYQGGVLLADSASGNPDAESRGEQLQIWDCRMLTEQKINDAGEIVLRASCQQDCYFRTIASKEPTAVPIHKVATAVTRAFDTPR